MSQTVSRPAPPTGRAASRPGRRRRVGRQGLVGWLFVSPAVVLLGLFMLLPVLMAAWVSLLDWNGQSNPFTGGKAEFIGLENYRDLLVDDGLDRTLFTTSLRNNAYYVLLFVPLVTILSLSLALIVNQRLIKARSLFRTVFYFPSVTSTIAVSTVFLFLFQGSGTVNRLLSWIGITGPNWFADSRGVLWVLLGALGIVDPDHPSGLLADHGFLGLSWFEWLSGPSVAMCTMILLATWTTSGQFMVIFLAALQDIPRELEEAAALDGVNRRQLLRHVILPALRPVLFLVLTLALIGSWQVFDMVYVMGQGAPGNTTLTPAFLSYQSGFKDADFGQGAAIAFILFAIILICTGVQRWLLRERSGRSAR
ncbi:carbohydrate ABC transporter permease [Streptomyces hainanensis]|uniref:Sugar ABC transporter permease n=1 Tax=Streptomyces hainanensis TaxID=402648 RepID=A0A4R4TBY9_9ACTN|nr:sugar ABC transporter permease [Streptomyces hainanensis]TDC74767.1 sugar ABC transporter permease [Streptomyces hainanensis]